MKNKYIALLTLGVFGIFVLCASLVVGAIVPHVEEVGETMGGFWAGGSCDETFVADTNYADGEVLYMYGAWKMYTPSGVLLQEQALKQIPDGQNGLDQESWSHTFVIEEIGSYTLDQAILYVKQTSDGEGNWETVDSGNCVLQSPRVFLISTYTGVNVEDILVIIQGLYDAWQSN